MNLTENALTTKCVSAAVDDCYHNFRHCSEILAMFVAGLVVVAELGFVFNVTGSKVVAVTVEMLSSTIAHISV